MKKQLVIVGITLVLLTVGLSGCETKQNKTQNEIELEGKIAFNSESSWGSSDNNIHIINPDGTNEVRITEGMLYGWSPDGKKILYGDNNGWYTINPDGTGKIKIVNYSENYFTIVHWSPWSPDGRKILLTTHGSDGGVYTINADGDNLVKIVGDDEYYDAIFTPDGMKIIYQCPAEESNYRICAMNYDGTNRTTLFKGERAYALMCSPNGKKISFLLGNSNDGDLYTMNYDGTNVVKLAEHTFWPTWSPDGNKIAYSQIVLNVNDEASLYISNSDGTGKVSLIENVKVTDYLYLPHSWSPDGKKMAYSLNENIYIIGIDGSDRTQLAVGSFPQWSPS